MKKKILVVEKDHGILEIVSHILVEEGYVVKGSQTETGIFELVSEFKPDVILLDIVQPTAEGTRLCQQIKSAETTKHIPVVVLSTHTKIEKVKEVCADEVIKKPFDIDDLVNTIQKQLV